MLTIDNFEEKVWIIWITYWPLQEEVILFSFITLTGPVTHFQS
jgi:hypothetical protein